MVWVGAVADSGTQSRAHATLSAYSAVPDSRGVLWPRLPRLPVAVLSAVLWYAVAALVWSTERALAQALRSGAAAPAHAPNSSTADDGISAHALEVGGGKEEEKPGGDMGERHLYIAPVCLRTHTSSLSFAVPTALFLLACALSCRGESA